MKVRQLHDRRRPGGGSAPIAEDTVRSSVSRRRVLQAGGGALAAGLALAGCGSGAQTAGKGNGLGFMYWGSSYEDAVVRKMLEGYGKETGLSVTPLFTPGTEDQYNTKLNVLVASGDAPDVLYSHEPTAYSLAERGLALNVLPYFDKYPALADRFPGSYYFWEDGKCLGTETGPTINCLYYRRSAFDTAKLDHPPARNEDAWDWDEFLENAIQLTYDAEGRHPEEKGFDPESIEQYGVSGFFANEAWYAFVRANGGDLTSEDGRTYALDGAEAVEALQRLQDLIHRYHVSPMPKPGGASGADTSTDFRSGRVAMAFDGTWTMLNLNQEDIDFGIGVHPRQQEAVTIQSSGCTMINARTPIPEQAIDFYLYHNDPHNLPELFTSGLWMPLEMKYYTNEEDIRYWTDNKNHPKEFRTAVIDQMLHHSVTSYKQTVKKMSRLRDVIQPAVEVLQQGRKSARELAADLKDQVQPLLEGRYTNPMEERS